MPVRMTGLVSNMDTESLIKGMMDAQRIKNKRVTDKQTLLTWKQDKWKELNAKLYKLYTDDLSKMRLQGNYLTKAVTSSNQDLVTVTGTSSAPDGTHKLTVNALASAQYVTGQVINVEGKKISGSSKLTTDLGMTNGTQIIIDSANGEINLDVDESTTIDMFLGKCREAGLNANYDTEQNRFFISSKNSGVKNEFLITTAGYTGEPSELKNLGLSELTKVGNDIVSADAEVKLVNASDSEITYNGAELTSSTNVITANGLTLTLKGLSEGETVSLNVTNDTQKTYDMVKKFITSYNDILKEMNDLYYATSVRGYAPLSDDEKEVMTDDQIKKWEDKIKDSILRRDNTLSAVIDTMRGSLGSTVEVDGKRYSLASYGIQTSSDYTEKGLLHIYGDKDDAAYSDQPDKLMKALESDPDTVMEVLSGISMSLYKAMDSKMSSIPNVRSAYTFYNDKLMATQQTEYSKKVATLEKKLIEMENKYYKQFSAMETALSKMQSQTNALASMMGTNK